MERIKIIRCWPRHRADGRYSVWRQLLQRRCLLATERVCARVVGRRAAGTVFQGRPVHAKVGTKLGDTALPLGGDAREQSGLVASTGTGSEADVSSLPHRSRPRILSDLRFSVAP